eukprot:17098-Eustigmatos_ZCMA.PRE.1
MLGDDCTNMVSHILDGRLAGDEALSGQNFHNLIKGCTCAEMRMPALCQMFSGPFTHTKAC